MSNMESVTILLVEDDLGHARLVKKNLRRALIHNEIVTLHNGQQAIDYLFEQGDYEGIERPPHLLMLLDLNMPRLNGYQVLERMKAHEKTKRIPVVILTTTDDPREVVRCYELGCSIYITKPVNYEQFTDAMRKLGLLLSIVTIPNGV